MIPMHDPKPVPPLPPEGGSYELVDNEWRLTQQTSPAIAANLIITPETPEED